MKKILTTISLLLFVTIAVALEYKPGKKHTLLKKVLLDYLLILNGKTIEHVFKPNLSACLKSKRIAHKTDGFKW